MPYKDPQKRADYDREYQQRNKKKLAAYRRAYRLTNFEEITENRKRQIRIGSSRNRIYLGVVGMTRKQRLKLQKELNGTTE